MGRAIKAVLLSGLLLPGLGHVYLKRYKTGSVLVLVTIAGLYIVLSDLLERAMQIVEKIQTGEVPMDAAVISRMVAEQPPGPDAALVSMAVVAVSLAWLAGVVDSFRVGWRQSRKCGEQVPPESPFHSG